MSSGTTDFEALLREALSPVDPPEGLTARMEMTLVNLTELAQDELEAWELATMRDPRNWARPAAAVFWHWWETIRPASPRRSHRDPTRSRPPSNWKAAGRRC